MSGEALILAIETAAGVPSVALLRGEVLVDEIRAEGEGGASEGLLPALDALLARAATPLDRVEAFAVSVGPGSFTGLRIGIATVKGLAFGTGRAVAPVPTLAALARAAVDGPEPVVALLDARRGEVYAGAWQRAGEEPHPCVPEGVYRPEELAARLPRGCALVGEGVALCADALGPEGGDRFTTAAPRLPAARDVGMLGARLLARGGGVAPAVLVPRYVRRAEAEVKRTGARFEDTGAER